VTASVSFTISETKLFAAPRAYILKKFTLLGELLSCGYCLGHWVALLLIILYRPRLFHYFWPLDYFISVLLVAWLAAFQWLVLCLLMKKAAK